MEHESLFNILNSFKSKTEAYNYFKITPNKYGIIKLNNIAEYCGFDINTYKERRKKVYGRCLYCDNELSKEQTKFCSHSCSAKYNKGRIVSDETKEKIRQALLKPKKIKLCSKCGQEHCKNLEVCNHTIKWFKNLVFFGFDINKIGTNDIYIEYYRIKELLEKEYIENELSPNDIALKYNYGKKSENILHLLKSFKIKTRGISESVTNACLQGKLNNYIKGSINEYQFKYGWYKTWYDKLVYYRSSYELDYAKKLDEKKVYYEMEFFRIKYWDTVKCKYRVSIPDFFIKDKNKIVEIKSRVSFNKQNMIDKFNEYIKLGFTVSLILEYNEYTYDEVFNLKENDFLICN